MSKIKKMPTEQKNFNPLYNVGDGIHPTIEFWRMVNTWMKKEEDYGQNKTDISGDSRPKE